MLNELANDIFKHNVSAGWWESGTHSIYVIATKLALCHSELSEALEGFRKNLMDDHLPSRKMAEVELADTIIRILDLAASQGFDIDGAIAEKRAYNANRADHKKEVRKGTFGKSI